MKINNISHLMPRVHKQGFDYWGYFGDKPSANASYPATFIVIHNTGVFVSDSDNPIDRAIADANYNVNTKWYHRTAPYHFEIGRKGEILQLIDDLRERTAHCSSPYHNPRSIGISFQGNLCQQPLTDAQKKSAELLFCYLKDHELCDIREVTWHRKTSELANGYATTDCPCPQGIEFASYLQNKFENINDFQMTKQQLKDFVQRTYRLVFGREELDEKAVNSWIEWIEQDTAQRVVDFPSVLLVSSEGKQKKEHLLKTTRNTPEIDAETLKFYLKEQPNGMARTFGEILSDSNYIG